MPGLGVDTRVKGLSHGDGEASGGGQGAALGAGFSTIWGQPLLYQSHIPPEGAAGKVMDSPHPQSEQVLKLEVVDLCLSSLQAPTGPSWALGAQGGWGKYLYVQVEDAMAVQVVQPLHQLLDVDFDLQ